MASSYSDDVKVLSFFNSSYVFIFDKKNQTFTVYRSNPPKTNDRFTSSYTLSYVMRLQFDLGQNTILDAAVTQA
jgi:hypothetical protein